MRLAVLETYSVARMFRCFTIKDRIYNKCDASEPDNIIYFGGNMHVLNVLTFLKYIAKDELKIITEKTGRLAPKTYTNNKGQIVTEVMPSQQIMLPLYNYFNLFDNPNQEIIQMSNYNSFERPLNPLASKFVPRFTVPAVLPRLPGGDYKKKYLKYKAKYMKLKSSLHN